MIARFLAHWRLKLLLTFALNLVFWTGYSFLGRHTFFPQWTPPLIWLDHAIPFQPAFWGWVYLSQFLFTGTLPWFLATKEQLRRYVVGLAVMIVVSFSIFLLFPVASPRPPESASAAGAMPWILGYDGAFNAFPSLHAAFLIYMAALARRMAGGALPVGVVIVGVLWGTAILYATIATRQHYALDLLAGGLLGYGADWITWRRSSRVSAATTTARNKGAASHDGCR